MLNEWLWSDVSGERGEANQAETGRFLEAFLQSGDRVVVVRGSAFDTKAWKQCKSLDSRALLLARRFVRSIRFDPDKCLLLESTALPALPKELTRPVNVDDHYLVQAQLAVPGSVVVTTDSALRQVLLGHGLRCEDRDAFLRSRL